MSHKKINGISSESVEKATGKSWDEWVTIIDTFDGEKLDHKAIARKLWDDKLVESGWWCQMVTVGYEYAKGRRTTGETAGSGFEVGVQKVFDLSPQDAWKLITSPRGMDVWLGKIKHIEFEKGYQYETADGTNGEIRTMDPGKRLRLTYQPKSRKESSTMQVTFMPNGHKTAIHFHHEKLANAKEREQMRSHWSHVLEQLRMLMKTEMTG